MAVIFRFSNENLSSYQKLYDFNDARVLSVGGSGDQYFTAILNGAKEVTLFDRDPNFWPYFATKFYAIQAISYNEFLKHFVWNDRFQPMFDSAEQYMPAKVKDAINEKVIKRNIATGFCNSEIFYAIETKAIPYLDSIGYERLQQNLKGRDLPDIHITDIRDLPKEVGKNPYDIMLTSNIYDWISRITTPTEYLSLLDNFNCPIFQAMYAHEFPVQSEEFRQRCKEVKIDGFVNSTTEKDYVYTYKK